MRDETTTPTAEVLNEIAAERLRQDAQWGGPEHDDQHTPAEWRHFREKFERTAGANFSRPVDQRRAALVKLAALAVAQIESIDRRWPAAAPAVPRTTP